MRKILQPLGLQPAVFRRILPIFSTSAAIYLKLSQDGIYREAFVDYALCQKGYHTYEGPSADLDLIWKPDEVNWLARYPMCNENLADVYAYTKDATTYYFNGQLDAGIVSSLGITPSGGHYMAFELSDKSNVLGTSVNSKNMKRGFI